MKTENHWPDLAEKLPDAPAERWVRPLVRFLHIESASGLLLLALTGVALALTNSPWAESFANLWKTPVGFSIGGLELTESLHHWINDGLMTIFFFLVGLEIKRELVAGELNEPRKAALPAFAALGGMVVPAAIYLALQKGQPAEAGWGIPMATDIAFVVGFLALLGPRVPMGLKILLLSLAIVDDLGAILVIAVFYTTDLSYTALGLAGAGFAITWICRSVDVRSVPIYTILGAGVWLAFLKSGIHPTVAGVILGLLTPATPWVQQPVLRDALGEALRRLSVERPPGSEPLEESGTLRPLLRITRESMPPLQRLELVLHPWVAFGIMPLFALANAGVRVEPAGLTHPVALSVGLALALGKPLGIVLFSLAAVKLGLARFPTGVNTLMLTGGGCLAGIGFTMSLFIAGLALEGETLAAGKVGTFLGSAASAVLGLLILKRALRRSHA